MQFRNVRRSVVIKGRKTSLTLEEPFWAGLREIAGQRGYTISRLVARIASERTGPNLPSAIRLYVLTYFKASTEQATNINQTETAARSYSPSSARRGR